MRRLQVASICKIHTRRVVRTEGICSPFLFNLRQLSAGRNMLAGAGKDKNAMKGRSIIALLGVFAMLVAAGCGGKEEQLKEEVTKAPVEDVTKTPESNLPEGGEEEPSYVLEFTGKEEIEELKDGEYVYFKSSLYYPVFEGYYADNMNRFVASVTETFRESLPDAKENAEFDYGEWLSGEYSVPIFPEEEELSVSCLWNREQYMTLFSKYTSYTGGAHPNVFCRAYVVDMTDGNPESIEDMLKPYGVTTDALVDYATNKLLAEHGEDLFEYDDAYGYKTDVFRFVQGNQWYFNEKGLVIFANPYEIAAYAYGMIECEISYEELEQGLKK